MQFPRFIRSVVQPHYIYRPRQLLRRIYREWIYPTGSLERAPLPWGGSLLVNPTEHIGRSVWLHGIYGSTVCEVLWRLSEPGMKTVDAGANIGVMTSLLAHRVGPRGTVFSFEPHPELYASLAYNVRLLRTCYDTHLYPFPFALHSRSGTTQLFWDSAFQSNRGLASLSNTDRTENSVSVSCTTLDELFPSTHLSILKIDVEGHESEVIRGSDALLSDGRIDHVIYECHEGVHSSLHNQFRKHEYTPFGIGTSMQGPTLLSLQEVPSSSLEISTSYLATQHPRQATETVVPNGWKCLTARP